MASPVDTSVKFFHSAMPGAPILSGQVNGMIPVLDACLVNGFGLKTADSLTILANVATINIATGHSAEVGSVIFVAGATPVALNGEQKVTAITGASLSFATAGLADQTATGAITYKIASAGWLKAFAGANLAAYKAADPLSAGYVLRVDDTNTFFAKVMAYESMSDVTNGVNPFPAASQKATGLWWSKSNAADATTRPWIIAVDSRFMYFMRDNMNQNGWEMTVFGDLLPVKVGDNFATIITGQGSNVAQSAVVVLNQYWYTTTTTTDELYLARSYTGLGTSMRAYRQFPCIFNSNVTYASGQVSSSPYPNGPDGGLYLTQHYVLENPSAHFRAVSPGFFCVPQTVPVGAFASRDILTGQAAAPGKVLKAILQVPNQPGVCFLDTTGPWR
jgi:hypothetical protein